MVVQHKGAILESDQIVKFNITNVPGKYDQYHLAVPLDQNFRPSGTALVFIQMTLSFTDAAFIDNSLGLIVNSGASNVVTRVKSLDLKGRDPGNNKYRQARWVLSADYINIDPTKGSSLEFTFRTGEDGDWVIPGTHLVLGISIMAQKRVSAPVEDDFGFELLDLPLDLS